MIQKVQQLIDEQIKPVLKMHNGDVELIDVDNNMVFIKFKGGCQGCAAATSTLKSGIERIIKENFPEITQVVDITSHAEGKNPYFKE